MKKLAAFLFAAVVAVSVQAASFDWSVTLAYYVGQTQDDVTNTGITGYLALVQVGGNPLDISVGSGGVLNLGVGNTAVTTVTLTGDGAYYAAGNVNSPFGTQYVVVGYDSVGNASGISSLYTTVVNPAVPTEALSYAFSNVANDSLGFDNGPSLELTPIPEPATMALVGIGAGVIALRRRFLKKA